MGGMEPSSCNSCLYISGKSIYFLGHHEVDAIHRDERGCLPSQCRRPLHHMQRRRRIPLTSDLRHRRFDQVGSAAATQPIKRAHY